MAIYNAPYDPRGEKFGIMGDILGQTLGALGGYAKQEYQKPSKIKELENSGYFTPEEAKWAVNLPPQQLSQIVQQKMKMQQQQQKNSMIGNILGGAGQQQPNLMSLPGGNIQERLGGLGGGEQQAPQQRILSPEQEDSIVQAAKGMSPQQIDEILRSGILNLNEINQVQGILDRKQAQQFKERAHGENKVSKEKSLFSKEKAERFKATEPFRAEAFKEEENAAHMQDAIGEQIRLSESGKMTHHGFLELLNKFGFDSNFLKNPTTEQFEALEKEYLKDLKSIFGGKISNDEMKAFLKGIPKSTNSPEARKAMLERWNAYYEAKGLKAKLVREITAKNDGIPPYDLRDQVSAKMHERQEQLSKKFLGIPEDAELLYNEKTKERAYIGKDGKMVTLH